MNGTRQIVGWRLGKVVQSRNIVPMEFEEGSRRISDALIRRADLDAGPRRWFVREGCHSRVWQPSANSAQAEENELIEANKEAADATAA